MNKGGGQLNFITIFFLADCLRGEEYKKMDSESEPKRSPDRDQRHGDGMEQSFAYSETRRKFLKQFAVTSAAMTLDLD
jgi:hypothetical protein